VCQARFNVMMLWVNSLAGIEGLSAGIVEGWDRPAPACWGSKYVLDNSIFICTIICTGGALWKL